MPKNEIKRYERGQNEHLDRILKDETVWIINGDKGRLPIIADTKEEALEKYNKKPKQKLTL